MNFIESFCISSEMFICSFFFKLLMCLIAFINFIILKLHFIIGINPKWSWWINFYIVLGLFATDVIRLFANIHKENCFSWIFLLTICWGTFTLCCGWFHVWDRNMLFVEKYFIIGLVSFMIIRQLKFLTSLVSFINCIFLTI
jgi:hypothetical protein